VQWQNGNFAFEMEIFVTTRKVIETIYGRYHKYEVVRVDGTFSTEIVLYRDGAYWKGTYSSVASAVEAAKKAG